MKMKIAMPHMRLDSVPFGLALLASLSFLCLPVGASIEKWTNKDGKSANIEFVRLTEKDGEEAAEFRMPNGKPVTIKLSALIDADAKRAKDARPSGPVAANAPAANDRGLAALDDAVKKVKAGDRLTPREKELCHNAFLARQKELFDNHHTESNTGLPEAARTEYFVNAMKMALIDFSQHGGWPTRSEIRLTVLGGLKKMITKREDSFVRFCAIFPALDGNDGKFAVESYKMIEKTEPYLAERIAEWIYGYYENAEAKDAFVKSTGIRPPAQGRVAASANEDEQAIIDSMDFLLTKVQPLLKEEKFDEAVELTEKQFKDNPGLPQRDLAAALAQIAVTKGVATGNVNDTIKRIGELKKRFPEVEELRMPGLREMMEQQIKARKQAGGGSGDDEVSPPQ